MTAEFDLTEFALHPLPDGRTWRVAHELTFRCASGLTIVVPVGFETDFASIPRVFWRILPKWDQYGPAAVVHDYLYATQTVAREKADWILREGMEVLHVPAWKRFCIYRAVRCFGGIAWKHDMRRKIATTAALLCAVATFSSGCLTASYQDTKTGKVVHINSFLRKAEWSAPDFKIGQDTFRVGSIKGTGDQATIAELRGLIKDLSAVGAKAAVPVP